MYTIAPHDSACCSLCAAVLAVLLLSSPAVRAREREMLNYMARAYLQRLGLLSPEWPDWAVDTFVCLSLFCVLLVTVQWLSERRRSYAGGNGTGKDDKSSSSVAAGPVAAARFRR